MNRRQLLAVSGALAAATLAGCTGGDGQTPKQNGGGVGVPDENEGTPTDQPAVDGNPQADSELLAELAAGNATFALDLHQRLADGGNQFFSPYSISVALAMTFAGARGDTREEMRDVLQYTLGEEVHAGFGDLQAALAARETTQDPGDEEEVDAFRLEAANALWGAEGVEFAEEYLATLDDSYGAGLKRAAFGDDPDGERERINDWVADVTEDRIDELLAPGSITPQTVLVLTNAIYFMASWSQEFDPENTEEGTFRALDGSESAVPFMHQELRAEYAALSNAQAVELPYVGQEVSMVLLVPDEGEFETFEANLDADRLFGIFRELGDTRGQLAMPKFEVETELQLGEALSEMGMETAFGGGANFDGMVEGTSDCWIDEVFHDAVVTVDEEGTEAAAATAVPMDQSAPPEWGELRLDRPFLFCIRDRPTDAVLFLGRVADAGAATPE